jgi:hypothetical protein
MTKPMSLLVASALALSLSSVAFAADEKAQDRPANPKTQNQSDVPKSQDPGATPTEQSKRYEEYLLAIEKCQDIQDVAKQQKCAERARKKYNRM